MLRLGMDLNEGVAGSRALLIQDSKLQLARFDWHVHLVLVLGGFATVAWTGFLAWEAVQIAYWFAS